VFEGIDGAGTTTQSRILAERLETCGVNVRLTAEPSGGDIGRLIRRRLGAVHTPPDPGTLALLFAADRRDHWKNEIEPTLSAGCWVVSDRYLWSSLAYQSLDHPLEWVVQINRLAPEPHLTLLLDLEPREALARLGREGRKEEIFDRLGLQQRVRKQYLELLEAASHPRHRLDGALAVQSVAERVWKHVQSLSDGRWS
jgi:dTMP kinase